MWSRGGEEGRGEDVVVSEKATNISCSINIDCGWFHRVIKGLILASSPESMDMLKDLVDLVCDPTNSESSVGGSFGILLEPSRLLSRDYGAVVSVRR